MLTLHRLFLRSAGIVFIAATLLFSAEPAMADSSGYQGTRYSGSSRGLRNYRGASPRFIRPRSAGYNRWYPWHREYSGNRYNYYGSYGNRYPGDVYRYQDYTISEDADLLSDIDYSDIRLGWLLLAKGEAHRALKTFSVQTRKDPNNSILKVGYALAAAETGDLHKGVSAMRGALRSDPDSLHNLTLDEDLQGIVKNLIHHYEDGRDDTTLATAATDFMIASLYYLLGDAESAGLVLPAQDMDSSIRNLDRLIQQM
jgi:tetratricopeptide (TPR) repeat protein